MKKITILILFTIFGCNGIEQTTVVPKQEIKKKISINEIQLIKTSSDVYEVEVEFGEILKFPCMMDTGCSETTLPPYIIKTLIKIGKIKATDQLPSAFYTMANGNIEIGERFIMRKVKIGNYILYNIVVSVGNNDNSSILLGQNVLKHFNKVIIDNKRNILILEK